MATARPTALQAGSSTVSGIVDVHHEAIPGQRAHRGGRLLDQGPDAFVELPEHVHHLLRLRALRERREASEAGADQRDLRAVALQDGLIARGDDQVGELSRQEPPQPAQALDRPDLLVHPCLQRPVELGELRGLRSHGVLVALDPQQGADPRQQLGAVEGLGDEVVGSGLERRHLLLLATGGDHQDRERVRGRLGAKAPAHLVAVHPGHQDVEEDDVRLPGGDGLERLRSGGRREHLVPLRAEDGLEQAHVGGGVVHHEDARRRAHVLRSHRRRTRSTSSRVRIGLAR